MLAEAERRFDKADWRGVKPYTGAALVFQPDWVAALDLQRRAGVYAWAAPLFAHAQSLARDGRWSQALHLLRRVKAKAPGYPGAVALMATAKTKLAAKATQAPETPAPVETQAPAPAPKPKPTPTPTLPPPP